MQGKVARSAKLLYTGVAFVIGLLVSSTPALGVTYTWTGGGGVNENWSNGANWGGSGPSENETDLQLVFPALTAPYASNNDLTGLQVVSLSVATQLGDGDYSFTGSSITLSGAAMMTNPGTGDPNLVWDIPLLLGGNVALHTSGRQTQVVGPINLGTSTLTLDAEGDVVLAGVISGSGHLFKTNGSALTVRGVNTYTGMTTAEQGAFYISNAAALGSPTTGTTFNGGFLGFVPGSTFTITEPLLFNGGSIVAYGTPTIAGEVTVGQVIDVQAFDPTTVLTISGPVGGAGGLGKAGPGVLVLSTMNASYGGPTAVGVGTLRLDGKLLGTDTLTVYDGAQLIGGGSTAGAIHARDGATIAPGSSPGVLSCAGLTMEAGSTLIVEIEGQDPVFANDSITVNGPVNLGGATLAVTADIPGVADGREFVLIDKLGFEFVTGTFANLPEGASLQVGAITLNLTYRGFLGNDVVLVSGPPNTPTTTPTTGATSTASLTPTTGNAAPTSTRTLPPSTSPTPTATEFPPICLGDCNGNGIIAINELIVGVNIALGLMPLSACPEFDANFDDQVTIAELIQGVNNASSACILP